MADFEDLLLNVKKAGPELSEIAEYIEYRWNEQTSHAQKLGSKADELAQKYKQATDEYESVLLLNSYLQEQAEAINRAVQNGDVFRNGRNDAFVDSVRERASNDEIDFIDALALVLDDIRDKAETFEARLQRSVETVRYLQFDIENNVTVHGRIMQRSSLAYMAKSLHAPETLLRDLEQFVAGVVQDREMQIYQLTSATQQLYDLKNRYYTVDEQSRAVVEQLDGKAQERELLLKKLEADVYREQKHAEDVENACSRLNYDYYEALQQLDDYKVHFEYLHADMKTGVVYRGSSARADDFIAELPEGHDFIDAVLYRDAEQRTRVENAEYTCAALQDELSRIKAAFADLETANEALYYDIARFETVTKQIKETPDLALLAQTMSEPEAFIEDLTHFVYTHAMEESEARQSLQAVKNEADQQKAHAKELEDSLDAEKERCRYFANDIARLQTEIAALQTGIQSGDYFKNKTPRLFERARAEAAQSGHQSFADAANALLEHQEDKIGQLSAQLQQVQDYNKRLYQDIDRAQPFYDYVMQMKGAARLQDFLRRPETMYEDLERFLEENTAQMQQMTRDNYQFDSRLKYAYREIQTAAKSLLAKEQTLLERYNSVEYLQKYLQIARVNARHYCLAATAGLNYVSQALLLTKELARRQDEYFQLIRDGVTKAAYFAESSEQTYAEAAEKHANYSQAVHSAAYHTQRKLYEAQVQVLQQQNQLYILRKQCYLLETQVLDSQLIGTRHFTDNV